MPDLGFVVILVLVLATAAAFVAWPLLVKPGIAGSAVNDELATLVLRHRLAIEAMRDVEADHRAGSLDEAGYVRLRAEAEERAATTLAELERARGHAEQTPPSAREHRPARQTRSLAGAIAGALAALLVAGLLLPAPISLANSTVVDEQLAAAQKAEQQRQAEISRLRDQLVAHPNDPATLVRLGKLYLDGGTANDERTAAQLLIFAIGLDPRNLDAYRLLVTAYVSSGDYTDASAATESLARIAPGSPDVPFFRGLIALQGEAKGAEAVRWFDAFLAAAPDDPRVPMVRTLRAQASGEVP